MFRHVPICFAWLPFIKPDPTNRKSETRPTTALPELSSVLSRRATRVQQRMRPRVRFRYERDTFRARRSIRRTHTASEGAADNMPLKPAESQSAWGICFLCLATTTMASFMQGARHFEPSVPLL